jgi:hypothetical protein
MSSEIGCLAEKKLLSKELGGMTWFPSLLIVKCEKGETN